jgi:hypothetical protein
VNATKVPLLRNIRRMVVLQVVKQMMFMFSAEQKGIVILKKQEATRDIASVIADTILIMVILIREPVFNDR